jgi:dipeptidyl aminopeptidase/acylaminoacyl peptidase
MGPREALAGGAQVKAHPCPVTVVAVRDKRQLDEPAAFQQPYRVTANPNAIPGPDSLRLIAEAPEGHPRVYIEDMRSGKRDDIVGTWAGVPAWSPDGKYIACVVYEGQQQPYQLAIIDRRTRRRIDIDPRLAVDEYRWSPDSRWIAVEGVERATNHVGLSVYDLVHGHLRRVSTTHVFGSYGLSWSPDSKLLAFTEPSAVDDDDEAVLAADLWVVSTSSWLPCRVRVTRDEIESHPEWLSSTAVLVKSVPSRSPRTAGRDVVFELRR